MFFLSEFGWPGWILSIIYPQFSYSFCDFICHSSWIVVHYIYGQNFDYRLSACEYRGLLQVIKEYTANDNHYSTFRPTKWISLFWGAPLGKVHEGIPLNIIHGVAPLGAIYGEVPLGKVHGVTRCGYWLLSVCNFVMCHYLTTLNKQLAGLWILLQKKWG